MKHADELAQAGPIVFRRIEMWRTSIAMHEPFRISSGEVADKEALLVKVGDGDAFGWGESSSMPGGFYSAETPDSCQAELANRVLPAVAGRRFPTMTALEAELGQVTDSRFVRVAVETAAWELLARQQGVSLRSLFGIPDRPVPSGLAVGLYDTPAELVAAIERNRPRDYKRMKIKIKRGHDVRLVRLVRERYPDIPLFVDANADYGPEDFPVFQELDREGLMMFEQPLARHDLEGAAALQKLVRTPVCLDEGVESLADARRAIELGSCHIVNIKIQRVGGFLEAIRIVEECAAHGIPLWMGTMPELGVGSAQALVLAAHPAFAFPTDVEPSARWYVDDILEPELKLDSGHLSVPPGPGLGFTIEERKVDRYAAARWTFQG
jgi:O-succinylbenzoate synthase